MKTGLMGGSFDPVHRGHLAIAEDALAGAGLDRVIFIPAAQAPLKPGAVRVEGRHRLELLKLAVAGNPRFEVSACELEAGGVSYSIDTARHFRRVFPADELFWIIGADQWARLPLWREIGELARLVEFVVMARPGYVLPAEPVAEIPGLKARWCAGRLDEANSTELRARLAAGGEAADWLPHNTVEYVRKNSLYR